MLIKYLISHYNYNYSTQDEIDKKTVLRANWKRLLKQSEMRTEELSKTQTRFKRQLLKDIKEFKVRKLLKIIANLISFLKFSLSFRYFVFFTYSIITIYSSVVHFLLIF